MIGSTFAVWRSALALISTTATVFPLSARPQVGCTIGVAQLRLARLASLFSLDRVSLKIFDSLHGSWRTRWSPTCRRTDLTFESCRWAMKRRLRVRRGNRCSLESRLEREQTAGEEELVINTTT